MTTCNLCRRLLCAVLSLFLIFIFTGSFAQQRKLVELQAKLNQASNDSVKVVLLNALVEEESRLGNYDNAISYSQQAIELAESHNMRKGLTDSYMSAASIYRARKQFATSLDYYLKALSAADRNKDVLNTAHVQLKIGALYQDWEVLEKAQEYYLKAKTNYERVAYAEGIMDAAQLSAGIYRRNRDYPKALDAYSKVLDLQKSQKVSRQSQASVMRVIADIYIELNRNNEALKVSQEILEIKKEVKDSVGIANAYNDMGFLYKKLDNYNEALSYFKKALKMNRELRKDEAENIIILRNIGVMYQYLRDYDNALASFIEAMKVIEGQGNVIETAKTCNYIATIYQGLQQYDQARNYTEKAISLAQSVNSRETLESSYLRLSEIYQLTNNSKKALEYYKLYAETKDKILEEQRNKQKELVNKQIEAEKKEKELQLLLVDQQIKDLALEKLRIDAARKEQEFQLLQRDKDLLEKDRALQLEQTKAAAFQKEKALLAAQQRLEAERQTRELELEQKNTELEKERRERAELEKKEQQAEMELLKKRDELRLKEIEDEKAIRQYFWLSLGLAGIVMALILVGFFQKQKANRKLASQNQEILAQKEEIEHQRNQISGQMQEIEKAYHNIQVLSEFGQRITATLNVESISQTVYTYINSLMGVSAFGIGLYNPKRQILEFKGFIENGQQQPYHYDLLTEESLGVWCFKHKKEVFINNAEEEATQYINKPLAPITGKMPSSLIYLPLMIEQKPLGVITVQSYMENAYSRKDITILQTLASYLTIALDNASAYSIIESKNQHITDSIRYAQTIQQAILPTKEKIAQQFPEHFVIYKPKDIVSGDFYWFSHIPAEETEDGHARSVAAVVDCTGHGVPGGFMSMIGNTLLNEIINQKHIFSPAQALEHLHYGIITALRQQDKVNDDGMDVVLCVIQRMPDKMEKVTFCGAKRPLYYVNRKELLLHEVKGTNKSIGGIKLKEREFEDTEISLYAGSTVYLTTDGMADQNNSEGRRLGSLAIKETLQRNILDSMKDQREQMLRLLDRHQHGVEQRDDITVFALRLDQYQG